MKFYLKCCNNRHEPIELSDGVPTVLGRSPLTRIADKKCSREQVEITVNYSTGEITLKQLGSNPSCIGDEEIKKGESVTLHAGDIFYFFGKEYPHTIVQQEKKTQKRTIESFFGTKSSKGTSPDSKRNKVSHNSNSNTEFDEEELSVAQKLQRLKGKPTAKTPDAVVASKSVKHTCEESTTEPGWSTKDDVYFYHPPKLIHSSKIAAFDMDGTLITTASGKTFAKDINDWKILYSEVPGKLKKLVRDGYKVVIITNQLGIGRGKLRVEDFKQKVESILKLLGAPIQVIAITKRGPYRKPNIGSWSWLQELGNGGIPIDMDKSFYIGDAAGRPKDWMPKKKKDFSCTDRLFALNLRLDFKTPEEFFLSYKPAKFEMPEFDPKSVSKNNSLSTNGENVFSTEQEVVVMVGYPASGKSFIAKEYFVPKGYVCINRDTMKTWQKCVAACGKALAEGKSVIVDNTNPDVLSRGRYVECAKKRGCECRCFVMQVTMDHARHNNRFRELSGSDHDRVPDMVFYQHRKVYQEPTLEEGFSSINKANFVPKFSSEDMRERYLMYND